MLNHVVQHGGDGRRDASPERTVKDVEPPLASDRSGYLVLCAATGMENDWRLSPAYDLIPAPQISIERRDLALACGDMGRHAHADNLRSQSARFLVNSEEAKAIIDTMEQTVKDHWYEIARRQSVSEKDCGTIRNAFAYDGFRLAATEAPQ